MGEKGNEFDPGLAGAAAASVGLTADAALIERVTTTSTHTLVDVGRDALSSIKDKALDKGADAAIEEGRRRLRPPATKDTPGEGPPAQDPGGGDDDLPRS